MNRILRSVMLFFMTMGVTIHALAQDSGKGVDVDIDVNKKGGDWYTQPWVWIVGVAVFILLLVALLRGSGSKASE
ncbi:MAG TPA: hypothetical protein VF476_15800 [Chitinophagaceae bacterium]